MKPRKGWVTVVIDPVNHSATVKGWKARDLIIQCGGRPIWSRAREAWCTSEATASDVLALADVEGYGIAFTMLGRAG